MAASFGGGIGRMRETCGAACGLFLVAGLKTGATEAADREGKAANYAVVQELAAEFKKRNGSLICAELLGLKKKEIQRITQSVIDFAELGDFLYQPVKKYSSGMKSRLGFSISLALDPDIFIVDEALSVGDKGFAKKCLDHMMKLRDNEGKTIFFVSHSISQVQQFCKTGMWIEGGRLQEMGDIETVCAHYSEYVDQLNALKPKEKKKLLNEKFEERVLPDTKKSFFSRLLGGL